MTGALRRWFGYQRRREVLIGAQAIAGYAVVVQHLFLAGGTLFGMCVLALGVNEAAARGRL